ncbi:flavodoxin [Thermodesulfovibrionales bacterium]|nr:flavodoxin [Thermodesulfovibrionales bacterium]MCL0036776.1 flavodoxin [Thermodesulfovibrionales bacterium]MCL0042767.1 flavodoxin [Thermodesulfovibrionales bacterium]MCL0071360.1 flavodoxin [Thermodesulfovibrionales bacterium]MCL0085599.1 flavodoxin [Thermodesulfovibrionales bacterium]
MSKKALIIYGSSTGNTESVAEDIGRVLKDKGIDTIIKNVQDASIEDIGNEYGIILFGCSTWGEDELELQPDFIPFYDSMNDISFTEKKIAVFGCGESGYTYFCGAVDAIEERVRSKGANVVIESLKIDGDPMDADESIKEWATSVAEQI